MKLLLIKILLQRRARDEGFVLPVVIVIGLIMILLSSLNVVQSSEENISSITQNQRSGALAAAEIGVARYREFLDRNRALTMYDLDRWDDATEVCDVVSNTGNGWASTTGNWRDIAVNGSSYKIVNYIYDIDDDYNGTDATHDDERLFSQNDDALNDNDPFNFNDTGSTYNPRGILTIKGRDSQGSEAQVEVEIPVRINTTDMDNLAPILWIGNSSATNLGTVNLTNGNLVYSSPTDGTNSGCNDPDPNNANIISTSRGIPPITYVTDGFNLANINNKANEENDKNLDADIVNTDVLVGQLDHESYEYPTGQTPEEIRYYYTRPGNLSITNSSTDKMTVESDGTAKVTWYIQNGNLNINNTGGGNLDIIGTTSSAYLEIYLDGNNSNNININTGSGGTINIKAFIHAPNATVNISGSGTLNIEGAVWVRDWNNTGSATVNIASDNTGALGGTSEATYKFYSTSIFRTPNPITNSPTNWKTEEVTP